MVSKLLIVVFALSIFSSLAVNTHAAEINTKCNNIYSDVTTGNSLCIYIEYLLHQEVISPNENFNSDGEITRGQFSKMIVKAFDLDIDASGSEFPDVPSSHTFYKEIMTLKNLEVIKGEPNGDFAPDGKVTRGAAMKFIRNAAQAKDDSLFPIDESDEKAFPDIEDHTFEQFIKDIYSSTKDNTDSITKVIGGYKDGTFRPNVFMTRAQVAKVLGNTMMYAEISLVSCSETYCQDKFIAGIEGDFFNLEFDSSYWENSDDVSSSDFQDMFTEIVSGNTEESGVSISGSQTAILLGGNEESLGMFFALGMIAEDMDGTTFEDIFDLIDDNKTASETFGEMMAETIINESNPFDADSVTTISKGLEQNGLYRVEVKMNNVPDDSSTVDLYGYFEFGIVGNNMHINIALTEEENALNKVETIVDSYEIN